MNWISCDIFPEDNQHVKTAAKYISLKGKTYYSQAIFDGNAWKVYKWDDGDIFTVCRGWSYKSEFSACYWLDQ